jgi:hypothetical protein
VRADGSDTACDGSADAANGPSRPACALATPQAALDALPDVLLHSATVSIAPGIYRTGPGGVALDVAKVARASAVLTLRGSGDPGTVVLSGDDGVAGTADATRGLFTSLPIDTLVVQNLTFDRFADAGLRVSRSSATLDAVTVQNSLNGVVCERASSCVVSTTLLTSGSGARAVNVLGGSRLHNGGTVTTLASDANGLYVEGSVVSDAAGATWLLNSAANSATSAGFGALLSHGSAATFAGTVRVTPGGTQGLIVTERSSVVISGGTTINTSRDGAVGFQANVHSSATITGSLTIDQAGNANTIGLATSNYSVTSITAAAPVSVTRSTTPLWTVTHATFYDAAAPAAGVVRTVSTGAPFVANLSLYFRGKFPAAGTCAVASQCL